MTVVALFDPQDKTLSAFGSIEMDGLGFVKMRAMAEGYLARSTAKSQPIAPIRRRVDACACAFAEEHGLQRSDLVRYNSSIGDTVFHPRLLDRLLSRTGKSSLAPAVGGDSEDPNAHIAELLSIWCADVDRLARSGDHALEAPVPSAIVPRPDVYQGPDVFVPPSDDCDDHPDLTSSEIADGEYFIGDLVSLDEWNHFQQTARGWSALVTESKCRRHGPVTNTCSRDLARMLLSWRVRGCQMDDDGYCDALPGVVGNDGLEWARHV